MPGSVSIWDVDRKGPVWNVGSGASGLVLEKSTRESQGADVAGGGSLWRGGGGGGVGSTAGRHRGVRPSPSSPAVLGGSVGIPSVLTAQSVDFLAQSKMKTPRLPPIGRSGAATTAAVHRSVSLSPSQLAQHGSRGQESMTRRRARSESSGGRNGEPIGPVLRVVRTRQELEASDVRRRQQQREQAERARRVAMGRRRQQQLSRLKAEEEELSALDMNVRKSVGLGVRLTRRIR